MRVYQAGQNPLRDNRSPFPPPLPIPPVELDSYLQNARDQQRQRGANSRIGRHWQILINGLNAPRNRGTAAHPRYLDIAALEDCYNLNDKSVIALLISKASSWGLNQIAAVYLQPLMYSRKSAKRANARGELEDYSPLTSVTLTAFAVPMETLSDKKYPVRSFFSAVHAILYYCLPHNQSLREYTEILTHLRNLLARALRPYLSEQMGLFRVKISLLVCLSPANSRDSRAIIGFSAVGKKQLKSIIIQDRMEHLRALQDVRSNGTWPVGNCAEDETFAHIPELCSSPIGQSRDVIAAFLTVDILEGNSNGPCQQCRDLINILLRQLRTATILSLAVKRNRREVEGSEYSSITIN